LKILRSIYSGLTASFAKESTIFSILQNPLKIF